MSEEAKTYLNERMFRTLEQFSTRFRLTERERETLIHICSGLRSELIARRMNISHATARFHARNLYRKTGVTDKVEVVLAMWSDCVATCTCEAGRSNSKPPILST